MRRIATTFVAAALVATLAACGGGTGQGESSAAGTQTPNSPQELVGAVPGEDDSIKIDEIDWAVEETVIDGDRKLAMSYANNSSFTILELRIEFNQREDVTGEDLAAFDEAYADPDWSPSVEATELYIVGDNQHFVEPGEEAGPIACSLAYAFTGPTLEQYELMEPNVAGIVYLGRDGKLYCEYYDFLNDSYSQSSSSGVDAVEWSESDISELVPEIDAPVVNVGSDDEDRFVFNAYGLTLDDFAPYVEKCKELGFTEDPSEEEDWYTATNEDGYEIWLNYYAETDSIYGRVSLEE